MIGRWVSAGSALIRRHVSNPSIAGITASSRIRSGVTCASSLIALAPSVATRTVMPAVLERVGEKTERIGGVVDHQDGVALADGFSHGSVPPVPPASR